MAPAGALAARAQLAARARARARTAIARALVPGPEPGRRALVPGPGPGPWSLVPGPGPWALVPGPGPWVLVPGPGSWARALAPGPEGPSGAISETAQGCPRGPGAQEAHGASSVPNPFTPKSTQIPNRAHAHNVACPHSVDILAQSGGACESRQ